MNRTIIGLSLLALLAVLAILQGCGSAGMFGSSVICEGMITSIPPQYQHQFDSLVVTLITPDRTYTRRIPIFIEPETATAPFRIGAAEVKAMFSSVKYSSQDSISVSLQEMVDAVVRVSLVREPERGTIDSLILNEFNFDVSCDTLLRRFDSLGTVTDLVFEKSYVQLKIPTHSVQLGSPQPGDRVLTLAVEIAPTSFSLSCGYKPHDKYRR